MSELKAGKEQLLELDLDMRLVNLMYEAGNLAIVTRGDVKDLVVKSHWQGVEDASSEELPEKLYTEHGYGIPTELFKPVPQAWYDPEYIPSDEEIFRFYEGAWEKKISDTNFYQTARFMRAAYIQSHVFAYLFKKNLL